MRYCLIFTILLCLGFSGCGGSSEEAPPPGAVEPDFEPAPAAPAETHEDDTPEPSEDPDASPAAADAVGSIPLLERMSDPFAISLRDHLSKLSPVDAGNYVLDEVLKTADEFSQAANALNPTPQDYEKKFPALVDVQLKMRCLIETAHYLSSRIPEEEQDHWKSKFQSQAGSKLNELSATLRNQSMVKASQEISNALLNFSEPFQDIDEMLAKELAANAPPQRGGGRGGSSPGGGDMPKMAHDDSDPGYNPTPSFSSSSGSGLERECKSFFSTYKPEGLDLKKYNVSNLTTAARKQLLGYPRSGGGSGNDPAHASSSSRRGPSTTTRSSSGGLRFEEDSVSTPVAGLSSGPREELASSTRKCITYALKQMLHKAPDPQTGGKIAAAYCAFAEEDFVPEVAKFLEKFGKGLTENDLVFLTSLSIEGDYGNDPRVQFLLGQTIMAMKPKNADDPKFVEIFQAAPGVGRFLVGGLNVGATTVGEQTSAERTLALQLLYTAGDADSALEVVKLLNDEKVTPMFKKAALDVLGQCGDERVSVAIIRCLRTPDLQERAKEALIRIGAPAEAKVLTVFNARDLELDLIALDILQHIGAWDSITKLSSQLKFYADAKTEEEQNQLPEAERSKSTVIMENSRQLELVKKTTEAGVTIIARMHGKQTPSFNQKSRGRVGMSHSPSPSPMSDPGAMPDYGGSGRPTQKKDDGKSPRTLVGAMEKPPGSAPVAWAGSLADSSNVMFGKMLRVFAKSRTPEAALAAGAEMHEYDWVEGHYNTAASQLYNDTLQILNEPAATKAIESSLERIKSRRENYVRERTLFNRTKSDAIKKAFNQGYKTKASNAAGTIH